MTIPYKFLRVNEGRIGSHADLDRRKLLPFGHSRQNPPRNLRQQRIGQNVVHVARAAFHFRAAPRDFIHQRVIV